MKPFSSQSRREFLGASALLTAGLSLDAYGAARRISESEKLNIGIIGAGGRGWDNLQGVKSENIVALCDVDDERAAQAYKAFPNAKRYKDFRKMLEMEKSLDAVTVSTPDHTHAVAAITAMRAGKHVYCEKPLAHSIAELRQMAKVASETGAVTQMGTQGHAMEGTRRAVEVFRSGAIGDVTELHVWTDRPTGWWPQGIDRPRDTPPVPSSLDWNLWLGVASARPYHPAHSPSTWRGWKDFGTGAVGDMGIHNAAMPFAALQLGPPASAEILQTSGLKPETFPVWSRLKLEFSAVGRREPITMYWYDGGQKPSAELVGSSKLAANGAIVVGTKGTLSSVEWTGGDWALLPRDRFRDFKPPRRSQPRAPGQSHHQEWLAACRGGEPAFCRFEGFASKLTETMLVANLALRTGRKIHWNAEAMEARGCPEASLLIRPEYRVGW